MFSSNRIHFKNNVHMSRSLESTADSNRKTDSYVGSYIEHQFQFEILSNKSNVTIIRPSEVIHGNQDNFI